MELNKRIAPMRGAQKWKTLFALVLVALIAVVVLPGCREKGPAEKAGEKIDKAVDDVKDGAKDAADKVEDKVTK
jgi:outer membrane lipoprotein-sorting protein